VSPATARAQRGFSLVEVVLALALLGTVLIAISGLFALGSRQLQSGREQTTALAVARDVLEEMDAWGFDQLYGAYAIPGTDAEGTVDTRSPGYASRWQDTLAGLDGGYAEIHIEALAPGGGSPPALEQAEAIRIRVTVHWVEGARERELELATVRL